MQNPRKEDIHFNSIQFYHRVLEYVGGARKLATVGEINRYMNSDDGDQFCQVKRKYYDILSLSNQ